MPSCPPLPAPHEKSSPVTVTASEWYSPADTARAAGTGVSKLSLVRPPNSPLSVRPKQRIFEPAAPVGMARREICAPGGGECVRPHAQGERRQSAASAASDRRTTEARAQGSQGSTSRGAPLISARHAQIAAPLGLLDHRLSAWPSRSGGHVKRRRRRRCRAGHGRPGGRRQWRWRRISYTWSLRRPCGRRCVAGCCASWCARRSRLWRHRWSFHCCCCPRRCATCRHLARSRCRGPYAYEARSVAKARAKQEKLHAALRSTGGLWQEA